MPTREAVRLTRRTPAADPPARGAAAIELELLRRVAGEQKPHHKRAFTRLRWLFGRDETWPLPAPLWAMDAADRLEAAGEVERYDGDQLTVTAAGFARLKAGA